MSRTAEIRLVEPPQPAAVTPETVKRWIEAAEPRSVLDALVTPAVAELCLRYNVSGETNRRLSKASVAACAKALRENRWRNTGEPVIFSDAQWLNDGQHRLRAIIETGIAAVVDLRFGVPRSAFSATNSGGKRSGADALTVVGAGGNSQVASVARLVLAYELGLPGAARQRVANDAIVRAVERWDDIPAALRYPAGLPAGLKNAATLTLAFFASRTANEPAIRDFFAVMETGEGRASDPPHRFREAMLRHRGGQDSGTRVQFLALGVLAWNAWRKSPRRIDGLAWKQTMPFPRVDGLRL